MYNKKIFTKKPHSLKSVTMSHHWWRQHLAVNEFVTETVTDSPCDSEVCLTAVDTNPILRVVATEWLIVIRKMSQSGTRKTNDSSTKYGHATWLVIGTRERSVKRCWPIRINLQIYNSERMIFSTDEWIREISCRTFDRAFLHSSKSNGALRVSTVHSFTLGLNDTQTEKIPSQPV